MNLYGIYDTKNNDVCLGLFTAKEAAKRFEINIKYFYGKIRSRKGLLKRRYEIVKFTKNELKEKRSD